MPNEYDPGPTREFIQQLLEAVPELHPVIDDHVSFNEELLPYVVFGDITRWIIELHRSSTASAPSDSQSDEILERILAFLEHAYASNATDPQVRNLIGVSFLEELDQAGVDYPRLKDRLGPHLRRELERWE